MTARATLFFEPLDVLQFRDHRPFDAGYHTSAASVFPMPSVFLGCVRTALLRDQDARFGDPGFGLTEPWARELLGTSTKPGSLTLRGPLLARWSDRGVEPLFAPPRDVAKVRSQAVGAAAADRRVQILGSRAPAARRFHGPGAVRSDGDVLWSEGRVAKDDVRWLFTRAGAEYYLAAGPGTPLALEDPAYAIPTSKVYKHEHRVGIIRNDERLTADDHMLYVTRPFRLAAGVGFAVDVELPGGPADEAIRELDRRVVPLGGKAHRARIRCVDGPLIPDDLTAEGGPAAGTLAEADPVARRRKLWLITPLVLGVTGEWPAGVTCTASERTVPVGGFDLARRAPKPLRQALPAGTVLTIHGLAPGQALAALGGAGWTDDRRAGYGVALAGKETEHP